MFGSESHEDRELLEGAGIVLSVMEKCWYGPVLI